MLGTHLQGQQLRQYACLHRAPGCHLTLAAGGLSAGHASGDSDYISTLTKLFKDIATAVQDNQQWVVDTFGREALLQTVLGLQEECDVQVPTL